MVMLYSLSALKKLNFFADKDSAAGAYISEKSPTTIWRIELTYLPTCLPTLIASKPIPSLLELPTPATTTAAVVKQCGINPIEK